MFKSWRNDKKKIRALFKLQFQATQVPKLKKPALVISLVPDDVGKPTFKLEKAAVQDGICLWENPIYVTVKLIKEQKTGKLHEKIYHFIVSSGSSKSGYLGESSIDFADFAEETEPCTVSLPLKFANSGAILHVTIQKVPVDPDGRYIEDYEECTLPEDESLKNISRYEDEDNKRFCEDSKLDIKQNGGHNGIATFQSLLQGDSTTHKETMINARNDRKSSADWSMGSASDGSLVDSHSPEDGLPREMREASSETIVKLRAEILSLTRQAELTELELQSLRKQVTKEIKKAQDFSRQVVDLKEERDALEMKCEELKSSSNKRVDGGEALKKLQAENREAKVQLEEIRQELCHQKDLNTSLKLQLQQTQESNSELMFAVKDLDEMMEQKNTEINCLSSKLDVMKNDNEPHKGKCKCTQQAVPRKEDDDAASELYIMKKKITDLSNEIEAYREDREKLETYIEQLTQDYEDLKQENQDMSSKLEKNHLLQLQQSQEETTQLLAKIQEFEILVQRLEETITKQTLELSESEVCINKLKNQVQVLEKELEKQAQMFENDLDAMTQAKIEQEQRAIRAEETLRNTKWKNAVTAERLQDELKRLSMEMAGKLNENEKLMAIALEESNELRLQKRNLEERVQRAHEELMLVKEQYGVKVEELSAQLELKEKQLAWNEETEIERKDLEEKLAAAHKEVEKTRKENLTLKSVKGDKEKMIEKLLSDLQSLREEHNGLKDTLVKEELEKENLRNKLLQSKGNPEKRENGRSKSDRKFKNDMREHNSALVHHDLSVERNQRRVDELLHEMELVKERNKSMETELKELQERYSEMSLKFAEVEGERQKLVMTLRNLKGNKK